MASKHLLRPQKLSLTVDHANGEPAGVELTVDPANGEVLVAAVIAGSRAEVAGLERGHQLWKVNSIPVKGKQLPAIGAMLRGKQSTLLFLCHNLDNPTLWAKMLSRGQVMQYKTRDMKTYTKMMCWADCRAGTINFAPSRNAPARQVASLKMTDIGDISPTPPTGPAHEAHLKRMDMVHHREVSKKAKTKGGSTAAVRKEWVAAQKKAHKAAQKAKSEDGCIELGCYTPEGYMILDHTKDLMIEPKSDRWEWLYALQWCVLRRVPWSAESAALHAPRGLSHRTLTARDWTKCADARRSPPLPPTLFSAGIKRCVESISSTSSSDDSNRLTLTTAATSTSASSRCSSPA